MTDAQLYNSNGATSKMEDVSAIHGHQDRAAGQVQPRKRLRTGYMLPWLVDLLIRADYG